jgi:hypothetical protein
MGVYVGQLLFGLYLYEPQGASLWPLGMVLAFFYCVAALAGALASAILMWLIHVLVTAYRLVQRPRKQAGTAG